MKPLLTSFQQTLRSLRLVSLLYCITLVLGLLATLPFYRTLLVEDQNSLAFLNLLGGFDYTVYSDFMHRSERTLAPLLSLGRWLGLLYVLLSVFFSGGILAWFTQYSTVRSGDSFSVGAFWQACSYYVGRFMRLFGITLLAVVVGAGFWLIIGSLIGVAMSDTFTERGQFWLGLTFFVLAALNATLFFCISDYARVLMVREDRKDAFQSFRRAIRLVFRNIGQTYGLYWFLIGIGTACFGVYFLLDDAILMQNWPTILLMFLIQQALIFVRIALKVWSLGMAYTVYESLSKSELVLPPTLLNDPTTQPMPDSDNSSPSVG